MLPQQTVDRWPVLSPVILVAMTLACYWVPMTSSQTSIQWDAADQFQVAQNYLSQELHAERIPFSWPIRRWAPGSWLQILGMALAFPLIGTLISAVATGPGLELAIYSVRASLAG